MGIFDKFENAIGGSAQAGQEQHESMMKHAMQMFGNRDAIGSLLGNAQSQGLGHIVQSWISNGTNQSIEPDQVSSIIGQDRLEQLAARVGLPTGVASAVLSRVLPSVVDRLTPNGKLPEERATA
jgi:uncharacterized protein YidB (DUF937 family)